jgi:aquaporin related protein
VLKEQGQNGTCCAMCVTLVNTEMTSLQGLLAEFLVTSILVLVVCSVFDRRNARNTDSVSIKFGLTVAAIAMNEVCFTNSLLFALIYAMILIQKTMI